MKSTPIEVELDDGRTFVVRADGRDIRAWEGRHGESFIAADFSYTLMTELAGTAAVRSGDWGGTFEEFMEHAVNVAEAPGDEGGPTGKGRGDGQSSPSRSEPGSGSGSGKKQATKRS